MRTLLLLALLLPTPLCARGGAAQADGPTLAVVGFKYSKTRHVIERLDSGATTPAPAMTAANRNFERNRRANDPAGVRDPNADSLDGRSAAMEKNIQEARAPKRKEVDGYEYRVKFRNGGAAAVEVLFWEYQFAETSNPSNVARRQFLCGVAIKPGKEKDVVSFSISGPSNVVSAGSLANESGPSYAEKVVVNRVEYADGTIWQRKDWNFLEVKESVKIAVSTPWGTEMCRGL
ncbi:MAG TPA: hypothetical protein VM936_03420 [Pyrinomonadaceae bacterium]|jgi:hypothetical protein|nr:hypothetical protein [Pyrinomonadaceae bacterium]